jgi:hypothetical protein
VNTSLTGALICIVLLILVMMTLRKRRRWREFKGFLKAVP